MRDMIIPINRFHSRVMPSCIIYWRKNNSVYIGNGRRGGLMVSELDYGWSGPGSSPGRGLCVVFLGKTLNSHSASLHQVYKWVPANVMLGVTL